MKVFYAKGVHVTITFGSNELQNALKVLKALAKAFRAPFIQDAVNDMERDLAPKLNYDHGFRLCEACKMEINLKKDSHIHRDNRYTHYSCPPLKDMEKRK